MPDTGARTVEAFTNTRPTVTNDPLAIKPPFEFRGLSARIFPLRASLDALQQLSNDYLTVLPPQVGRFRVVVPHVYPDILDYAQITAHGPPIGGFAQTEEVFAVPVRCHQDVNQR